MNEPSAYLLVIGDRDALAWILTEQRMAFSSNATGVDRLSPGSRIYLYATRGCFKNPTRDRGRVIGVGRIESEVENLSSPVTFAGRDFETGCRITIWSLAAPHEGPELGALVQSLHAFASPEHWAFYLRRTVLELDRHDDQLLMTQLDRVAVSPAEVLSQYQRLARRSG